MAESNGTLKTGNGHANGKMNGKTNGKMNGQAVARRRPAKKSQGLFAWVFSLAARIATWSAILTILFRCPTSLDACDDTSPFICKHYFQAKEIVSPHVQPYYDQYAAPYVEIAKPYYQTVDNTVLAPVRTRAVQYGAPWVEKGQEYALTQWEKNGQPQLAQLQSLAQTQYDQSVGPYLSKAGEAVEPYYVIARNNAFQTYYEFVLPSYEYVQPYAAQGYEASRDFTTVTALPTAYWAWNKTYVFIDTAVWPQLRVAYLDNVEPQLTRIGERLGRYKTQAKAKAEQEKLSASSAFDAAQSSFAKPPSHSTSVSSTTSPEETVTAEAPESHGEADEYWNPVEAPAAADNESEKRRKAREMVAEDLSMWQNKFAAQADEGATDMEDRVDEIAKHMMSGQAQTVGKELVETLDATIKSEFEGLKIKISSIVESSESSLEGSEEEVLRSIRTAGVAIKEKAQVIREWRETYDSELQNTVVTAADVHFQILDETRGLALQQIGMKWAWTDGVTYKDWAKYHELKSTLTQWTDQLKQLIVTHPTLLEAQEAAAQVEDEGMMIASIAAAELARLKTVGHYKILAQDATDNFESEAMELAAKAAQEAKEAASIAAEEAEKAKSTISEGFTDAVSEAESVTSTIIDGASEALEDAEEQSTAASQAASSVLSEGDDVISEAGDELSSTVGEASSTVSDAAEGLVSSASSVASEGQETVASVADDASSVAEDSASTASDSVSSVFSEASESASSVYSDASEYVSEPSSSTVVEEIKEASSSLASAATEALVGATDPIAENVTKDYVIPDEDIEVEEDPMTQREETPVSETPQVKPAFLGAAAQEVPERQVVLDDYIDPDTLPSATNAAAEAYSSAVAMASNQYSSAVSVVSAQIYGTTKPVHEQLFGSVSAAYDNALAAASSRFSDATAVKATPTATSGPLLDWQKAEAVASQRLNEGRLWAELQYSSALIAMGMATPTPTAATDKFYEQAKFNYYAGLGLAQDRYSNFMSAASSAFSSITATPTPTDYAGTASSMASVAKESAASVVNAAEEAAGAAYAAAADQVASAAGAIDDTIGNAVDAASEQMYIAGSAVAETWDNVIAELSGRVYGEPSQIGWYEGIMRDASSYASVATEAVAGGASSATDAAGNSAATATAEVAKQYNAVSELVSELLVGKEPSFTESVLSRLGSAYSTAAANVESFASDASAAASSVGDRVGSAAGQATDVVKDNVQRARDEL